MAEYSIGVDIGGTNLRAAAVSSDGKMLEKISGTTDLHEGREAVIQDIIELDQRLEAEVRGGHACRRRYRRAGIHSYGGRAISSAPTTFPNSRITRCATISSEALGNADLSRERRECGRAWARNGWAPDATCRIWCC